MEISHSKALEKRREKWTKPKRRTSLIHQTMTAAGGPAECCAVLLPGGRSKKLSHLTSASEESKWKPIGAVFSFRQTFGRLRCRESENRSEVCGSWFVFRSPGVQHFVFLLLCRTVSLKKTVRSERCSLTCPTAPCPDYSHFTAAVFGPAVGHWKICGFKPWL